MKRTTFASLCLVFALAIPMPAGAVSPLEPGKKKLVSKVMTLTRKSFAGQQVLAIVQGDSRAAKGVVEAARSIAKKGDRHKMVVSRVHAAIIALNKDAGPAKTREILAALPELREWVDGNPSFKKNFEGLIGDMMQADPIKARAAGYSVLLHLQKKRAGTLTGIEPRLLGDKKLYADGRELDAGLDKLSEHKSWPKVPKKTGANSLYDQAYNTVLRTSKAGEPAPMVVTYFDRKMHLDWIQKSRHGYIEGLKDHYMMSHAQAKAFVDQHMRYRRRDL
jgi:hypothetical protein